MPYDTESRIIKWFDDLKYGANVFYQKMGSIDEEFKNIVKYDESKFDKILAKYKDYRAGFHDVITDDIIDRHKILAGIMLAATDKENLIFEVDYEAIERSSIKAFPYWLVCPNEYYLYIVLVRILTEIVLATKKSEKYGFSKENYDIRFPDKIHWWEKGTAQLYKDQFCKLLSWMIISDDVITKQSLLASHLIFFYELVYDCAVKGMSNIYYD